MVVPECPLLTRAVHGDGSSSRGDFDFFHIWCVVLFRYSWSQATSLLLASVLLAPWAINHEVDHLKVHLAVFKNANVIYCSGFSSRCLPGL